MVCGCVRVTPYAERFLSELIIDEYDGGHHNPYTAYNYSPTGAVYGPLYVLASECLVFPCIPSDSKSAHTSSEPIQPMFVLGELCH